MTQRVLVTGASGLIGGAVVSLLLADDRAVRALARDTTKARTVLGEHPNLQIVRGDITDPSIWAAVLDGVDAVVHCAAYLGEYTSATSVHPHLQRLRETNVDAVEALLAAAHAHHVPVVVHVSSCSVYEPAPNGAVTNEQSAPRRDPDPYMQSKLDGEAVVDAHTGSVRVPIVQPGWVWGPGDLGVGTSGRVVQAIVSGKLIAAPNCANTIVDCRDVAVACLAALGRGEHARRYLVAGRRSPMPVTAKLVARAAGARTPLKVPAWFAMGVATLLEIAAKLSQSTPVATRHHVEVMIGEDRTYFSSARAETELGVRFRPLIETIDDAVQWYRGHGLLYG